VYINSINPERRGKGCWRERVREGERERETERERERERWQD